MIVRNEPTPTYTWVCPTCGKTGRKSGTHHYATLLLKAHWRRDCPNPQGHK